MTQPSAVLWRIGSLRSQVHTLLDILRDGGADKSRERLVYDLLDGLNSLETKVYGGLREKEVGE